MTEVAEGDVIEIRYCLTQGFGGNEHATERRISAIVLASEDVSRPIVRLEDGQITELRSFMAWRLIARSTTNPSRAEAA